MQNLAGDTENVPLSALAGRSGRTPNKRMTMGGPTMVPYRGGPGSPQGSPLANRSNFGAPNSPPSAPPSYAEPAGTGVRTRSWDRRRRCRPPPRRGEVSDGAGDPGAPARAGRLTPRPPGTGTEEAADQLCARNGIHGAAVRDGPPRPPPARRVRASAVRGDGPSTGSSSAGSRSRRGTSSTPFPPPVGLARARGRRRAARRATGRGEPRRARADALAAVRAAAARGSPARWPGAGAAAATARRRASTAAARTTRPPPSLPASGLSRGRRRGSPDRRRGGRRRAPDRGDGRPRRVRRPGAYGERDDGRGAYSRDDDLAAAPGRPRHVRSDSGSGEYPAGRDSSARAAHGVGPTPAQKVTAPPLSPTRMVGGAYAGASAARRTVPGLGGASQSLYAGPNAHVLGPTGDERAGAGGRGARGVLPRGLARGRARAHPGV